MRRIALFTTLILLFSACAALGEDSSPEFFQAPRQIVVTFAGDCTLGCTPLERQLESGFETFIENHGPEYPFSNVRDIFQKDDLTVVNLEGTFYDYEANRADKTYTFRAPTSYAEILPIAGIEAVSIGNNHALDYGAVGLASTLKALEEQRVAWFGVNEYANGTYVFEKDGVKIGFVSAYISYWWGKGNAAVVKQCFEELKAAGCAVIVASIHGGVEYDLRHDTNQERMADAFIRYGADVVIGHHPHTIQGLRVQDGRTTLWSLGNFSFGGNSQVRTMRTFLAQFTFSFDENGAYLGHQLNIIPAHVSGTEEYNNYQPVLVTGEAADAVLDAIQYDVKRLRLNPYTEGVGAVQDFVPAPAK